MSKIETFGLTDNDLSYTKNKIKNQKDYLESQQIITKDGEVKSLLDYSYSPNLSQRYYARILNKVDTFVSQAITKDLTPIFLTVTLDGFFRDIKKGNYTRFTEEKREEYLPHIPNNNRNGKYRDYMGLGLQSDIKTKKTYGNKLTDKDLYKILSHQLHRFTRCKTLQDIRQKHNLDYMMIRVTEPHKDGTPHFHILMYLPKQFIPNLFNEFKKFFPAPQNHKKINMRQDKRKAKEFYKDYFETKGFQTEIRSPAGYILKYILKSFQNLIEQQEIDYLQAWYIYNKIPRLITTHSLISQEVYHHASLLDSDWYYLTDLKRLGHFERDNIFNTFILKDNKREIYYENGYYRLKVNDLVIKEFGKNKIYKKKFTTQCPIKYPRVPNIPICLTSRFWRLAPKKKYTYQIRENTFIEVDIDGQQYYYDKQNKEYGLKKLFFPISQLTLLTLYEWYLNFDIEKENLMKYGLIKRELISRGLIKNELDIPLQEYNTNFDLVAEGGFEPTTFGL